MLKLRKINTLDKMYPQAERLFLDAFPENERRDIDAQHYNIDNNPLFHFYAIEEYEMFVGIITTWTFNDFRYVEHFAILPEKRSAGFGAKALQQFIGMEESPIVLEVEIPNEEIQLRRISFYQRQGFVLWENIKYYQPPYRKGDNLLPMMLMATKGLNPKTDYNLIRTNIYEHVYSFSERE